MGLGLALDADAPALALFDGASLEGAAHRFVGVARLDLAAVA
jgi:hypothetical protein